MPDQQLKLKYVFTPSPNPIRASLGGLNPNTIDLQVMISNPTLNPVELTSITIEIPVGEDSARSLSSSPSLPNPVPSTSGDWSITSSGDKIILDISGGAPGTILDNIIFTLEKIEINDTAGVVPITITELGPPKAVNDQEYALVKQVADFPITDFYATPQTLYDLDQTVTLYWTCSEQGSNYSYSVHSDSWTPKDCQNAGDCYTCQDGANGVQTPQLSESTNFALDVITTDSDGSRSIYKTLYTDVPLLVPSISQDSRLEHSTDLSGRFAMLYWLAYNSGSCTVKSGDTVIDDNAPTDTYKQGYVVNLESSELPIQLTVVANAISGAAQATLDFPNISFNSQPTTISLPGAAESPGPVAITPDGTLAFVVDSARFAVFVIDIAQRQAEPNFIVLDPNAMGGELVPYGIAITPDGALALVAVADSSGIYGRVFVIDIAGRQLEAAPVYIQDTPQFIAITPDGQTALATNPNVYSAKPYYFVSVIDIPSRGLKFGQGIPVGNNPQGIAITPDGALALTANQDSNDVSVIDMDRLGVENNSIAVPGAKPVAIAITPDGKLALVACGIDHYNPGSVSVIDIASRTAEPATIPVGNAPTCIIITPDGKVALVVNSGSNNVTVIDIANRRATPNTLPVGSYPIWAAITPDGKLAIVSIDASTVTVF